MSLSVGLQLPQEKKLAGILVMSGYLPAASTFRLTPGLEDVPVMHCHGSADPMVRYEWAESTKTEITRQVFTSMCFTPNLFVNILMFKGCSSYELRSYAGLGHSLNQEEIQHAMSFISSTLPHDQAFVPAPKDPAEMSVKELKEAIRLAGLSNQARGFCEKEEFVNLLKEHRK